MEPLVSTRTTHPSMTAPHVTHAMQFRSFVPRAEPHTNTMGRKAYMKSAPAGYLVVGSAGLRLLPPFLNVGWLVADITPAGHLVVGSVDLGLLMLWPPGLQKHLFDVAVLNGLEAEVAKVPTRAGLVFISEAT